MFQIIHTPSRRTLLCSTCQVDVGPRYDRCPSCASLYHLACVEEQAGCTTAGCEAGGRGYLLQSVDTRSGAPVASPPPKKVSDEEPTRRGVVDLLVIGLLGLIIASLIWSDSMGTRDVIETSVCVGPYVAVFAYRAWVNLFGSPF
jgi:hypothetical protein